MPMAFCHICDIFEEKTKRRFGASHVREPTWTTLFAGLVWHAKINQRNCDWCFVVCCKHDLMSTSRSHSLAEPKSGVQTVWWPKKGLSQRTGKWENTQELRHFLVLSREVAHMDAQIRSTQPVCQHINCAHHSNDGWSAHRSVNKTCKCCCAKWAEQFTTFRHIMLCLHWRSSFEEPTCWMLLVGCQMSWW